MEAAAAAEAEEAAAEVRECADAMAAGAAQIFASCSFRPAADRLLSLLQHRSRHRIGCAPPLLRMVDRECERHAAYDDGNNCEQRKACMWRRRLQKRRRWAESRRARRPRAR